MKVYTKTGDKGTTALIGGKRVKKFNDRIEAYGTIDELIAYISLLRDERLSQDITDQIVVIQNNLMVLSGELSADDTFDLSKIPTVKEHYIIWLEQRIDEFDNELPALTTFVLPGGHSLASHCHVARTICRRAERRAVMLSEDFRVSDLLMKYLNRLSDYLFMLSRKIAKDLNVSEILWDSRVED